MPTPLAFAPPATETADAHVAPQAVAETPIVEKSVPSMEQLRDQLFRDLVIDRLRAGQKAGLTPEQVTQALAREQRALAAVIAAPETIAVAAAQLFAAQKNTSDSSFSVSEEQASDTMGQILVRRAAEAANYAELLDQPAFCADMTAAAQAANDQRFATATLQEVKTKEMLEELKHVGPDGKTQVLAHVKQAQLGTILEHSALAQVFQPDGPLLNTLVTGLAAQLPGADTAAQQSIAAPWLNDRQAAALATVAVTANDGPAYLQAVADSKRDNPTGRVEAPAASHVARAQAKRSFADLVQL